MASKGSKIAAMIDQCEDIDPPGKTQRTAASRVMCSVVSRNVEEPERAAVALDLLAMLGLLPGQEDEYMLTGPGDMI